MLRSPPPSRRPGPRKLAERKGGGDPHPLPFLWGRISEKGEGAAQVPDQMEESEFDLSSHWSGILVCRWRRGH